MADVAKPASRVTRLSQQFQRLAKSGASLMVFSSGEKVLQLLEEVWVRQGKRQLDPPPPKPILKELRETERRARAAMKGGGKGS